MKNTDRIASSAQDFLPPTAGERYDRIMDVEPISRGFAYALCFGFTFWFILGLIFLFVKSL